MQRAFTLLMLLPLIAAFGASEGDSPSAALKKSSSARFYEATTYLVEGERQLDTIEGAVDWSDQEGWAEQRYANGSVSWRQVDDTCFQRFAEKKWQQVPTDPEGACGLAAMQNDPTKTFALIRRLAGVEKIGEAEVDGVQTTHYRATWHEAGKGPLELWVDSSEVVRRARYGGRDTPFTTIDYFDFGVAVDVERPLPNDLDRQNGVPSREGASE